MSALYRYATPLTTGLFLISLVSGIALFFHVGMGSFHSMHEILSMVLILPFALHLWRNWRPFSAYFSRTPMKLALAASAVLALAFAWPSLTGGTATGGGRPQPPQFAFANSVLDNTVAELAPIFDRTPQALETQLTAQGFTLGDGSQTLSDIATASGKTSADLIAVLMQPTS